MTSRFVLALPALAAAAILMPALAEAAPKSCSGFATITSYDPATEMAKIRYTKGSEASFFPKTEGAPNTKKLQAPCRGKVKKVKELKITPTGGRMTVTQIRANFSNKMLNDTDDKGWVGRELEKLVAEKTKVAVVIRPGLGKDAPLGITTIYLPITDEERAEIARLNAQVEDVD